MLHLRIKRLELTQLERLQCAALTKKVQEVLVLVVLHGAGGQGTDILTWLKPIHVLIIRLSILPT